MNNIILITKEQITDMMTFTHLQGEKGLTGIIRVSDLMRLDDNNVLDMIIEVHEDAAFKKGFNHGYAQCLTDNERSKQT